MLDFLDAAHAGNLTFVLLGHARADVEMAVRSAMAWVDETRSTTEFHRKIEEIDRLMTAITRKYQQQE